MKWLVYLSNCFRYFYLKSESKNWLVLLALEARYCLRPEASKAILQLFTTQHY